MMDKYKLGIGDAKPLDFWDVYEKFRTGNYSILEAINETIKDKYDGASLGSLATYEDKAKVCMAFIHFLCDVNTSLFFMIRGVNLDSEGSEGSEGHDPVYYPLVANENRLYLPEEFDADAFESVEVNVPTLTLGPLTANSIGQYYPSDYDVDGFDSVDVNIDGFDTIHVTSEGLMGVDVSNLGTIDIVVDL